MKQQNKLFILSALMLAATSASAGHQAYSARLAGGTIEPTTRFDCSDAIYVYVESNQAVSGQSLFNSEWVNPAGRVVKKRERQFQPLDALHSYAWDGIEINPGNNGIGGFFTTMFDPAAGLEDAIGSWVVKMSVDGEKLDEIQIEILC